MRTLLKSVAAERFTAAARVALVALFLATPSLAESAAEPEDCGPFDAKILLAQAQQPRTVVREPASSRFSGNRSSCGRTSVSSIRMEPGEWGKLQ